MDWQRGRHFVFACVFAASLALVFVLVLWGGLALLHEAAPKSGGVAAAALRIKRIVIHHLVHRRR